MARVTVQDCLEKVNNHFALVILAANRARQIALGGRRLVACDNKSAVAALRDRGLPEIEIRTWVRTGDTPPGERERMRRRPPHILVTTPESLYIMLGSASGRTMLATTRTVIVDEIHAVADDKRGAHLARSTR